MVGLFMSNFQQLSHLSRNLVNKSAFHKFSLRELRLASVPWKEMVNDCRISTFEGIISFLHVPSTKSYQRHGNSVHKRFAYKKQAFHVCLIESSFFISSFQKEVGHFFLKGAWFCFFRKFLYHIALSCSQRVVFFLLKWKWLLLNNM